ncbi:hypothetical protein U9M48_025532, partial [Paspalum notatum var. saurae]
MRFGAIGRRYAGIAKRDFNEQRVELELSSFGADRDRHGVHEISLLFRCLSGSHKSNLTVLCVLRKTGE